MKRRIDDAGDGGGSDFQPSEAEEEEAEEPGDCDEGTPPSAASRPRPAPSPGRIGGDLLATLLGVDDAEPPAKKRAPVPAPVTVAQLRGDRASATSTGSGSVAAMTAAWREQARQQTSATLGFDPELAKFAWSTTGPARLSAMNHPLMAEIEDTDESLEHSGKDCPLCQYTIAAAPPEDVDLKAVAWDDVRQGLSVLLGMCGDEISREQAITALVEYYQARVVDPIAATGAQAAPLTRELCRGHIRDVVYNPRARRKRSLRRMERIEAMAEQMMVQYNSVTDQCRLDVRTLNAYTKLVSTKEVVMRALELEEASKLSGGNGGASAVDKKPVTGWRFMKSNAPGASAAVRGPSSGFPGAF